MEITKAKWFKTTGGKVGIAIGIVAAAIGTVLLVKHFRKPKEETKKLPDTKSEENQTNQSATPEAKTETPAASDLPNGGVGCGPVRTGFDRAFNYVKCGNVWYTISKDKIKIPKWKSLADNKTASDLLNNKYPS